LAARAATAVKVGPLAAKVAMAVSKEVAAMAMVVPVVAEVAEVAVAAKMEVVTMALVAAHLAEMLAALVGLEAELVELMAEAALVAAEGLVLAMPRGDGAEANQLSAYGGRRCCGNRG
jgi:hypothetical protein